MFTFCYLGVLGTVWWVWWRVEGTLQGMFEMSVRQSVRL